MATLTENLISWLHEQKANAVHVGEHVPQSAGDPYIWIQQAGQEERELLCDPPEVDKTFYDIELVGDNISHVREETELVKDAFRDLGKYPDGFENVVEMFVISDHNDDYLYKSIDSDDRREVAALSLSVHHA